METTPNQGRIITMKTGSDQQYQWKLLQGGLIITNQNGPQEKVQIVLRKKGRCAAIVTMGEFTLEIPLTLQFLEENEVGALVRYDMEESHQTFSFALIIKDPLETTQDMR